MKPILHIIKNSVDTQAVEIIERQVRDNAYGVTAVFIQDALSLPPIPHARTCALVGDTKDKAISAHLKPGIEWITYEEMLHLIFRVESITVW